MCSLGQLEKGKIGRAANAGRKLKPVVVSWLTPTSGS